MGKRLLVCDLDNTLYDWVRYFVSSFYAMVDEVVRVTNCNREGLLDDFRKVHQRHHDCEHPFALLETETVRNMFPGASRREMATRLDSAFYAFNSSRKRTLTLYPGVREGLNALRRSGVRLIAHTDSKLFAVADRFDRLDLADYFSRIYCRDRPQSLHPEPDTAARWIDRIPMDRVVELSHHQRKPDPDVLREICESEGVPIVDAAYVGDSMARDILMARRAGVCAIWAKYGTDHSSEEYERLVRVTHWTAEDVSTERRLLCEAKAIKPDFIAEQSFLEVLEAVGVIAPVAE